MPLVRVSWSCPDHAVADVAEWGVYVRIAPVNVPGGPQVGTRVATAPGSERMAEFEAPEGRYVYVIVPRSRNGVDGSPIDGIEGELIVSGRDSTAPSAPTRAGIAPIDLSAACRAMFEPPRMGDAPHKLQVIEGGADPLQGKLVGEIDVIPGGPMAPDAARYATSPNALEGSYFANMPTTRKLWLRPVNVHGLGGTAVGRTVPIVDRPNHHGILVGSIRGSTRTNISAPTSSDAWELDATDGVRLRELGAGSGLTGWGNGDSGQLASQLSIAPYAQKASLVFDEKDLGAEVEFVLELFDQAQRKTLVSPAWATMVGDCLMFPSAPALDLDGREAHPAESPWWAMRQLTGEGEPTQPLRRGRWRYVAGTSSPLAYGDSDWLDYVPGEIIRARYVRVRLDLEEPTGFHQLISPNVFAVARLLMVRRTGTTAPESVVAAPPGSRFTDTTAAKDYVKMSGVGATGWVEAAAASGVSAVGNRQATGATDDRYYPAGGARLSGTPTMTPTLLRAYAFPLVLPSPRTIDRLAVYVNTGAGAGGVCRLALYANQGDAFTEPGAKLYESSSLSTTSGSTLVTASPAYAAAAGLYWVVVIFDVAAPVVRGSATAATIATSFDQVVGCDNTLTGSGIGWRQDLGAIALPDPWGTATTILTSADAQAPVVGVRFSA